MAPRERVGEMKMHSRFGGLLLVLAATSPLAGCATKKDMMLLRNEIAVMQARQDSLYRELNSVVLDSLRSNSSLLMRIRGDLGYQLLEMEKQIIQIQELTGLGQRQIEELRQQWQSRAESSPVAEPEPVVQTTMDEGEIGETYALGRQMLAEGSVMTARAAFASILASDPEHPLAADAQLQIAETYVAEENFEQAFEEFEKVIELFTDSPRAPTALYRAGMVAKELGDNEKARTYFNRVQAGYPRSDEAQLAAEELQRLRPRR